MTIIATITDGRIPRWPPNVSLLVLKINQISSLICLNTEELEISDKQ